MRIISLTHSDSRGGAARAALRLHRALRENDVESKMLVTAKSLREENIREHKPRLQNLYQYWMHRRETRAVLPYKVKIDFAMPTYTPDPRLIRTIQSLQPDLVHLHWITNGVLPIEDLTKIKAPLVWTLHDSWVFTGGCFITKDCDKFLQHCGNCPALASSNPNDLSRSIFLRKQKIFNQLPNLKFIAPSHWLADLARQSTLLKNHEIIHIPNALNTTHYAPHDPALARTILNLPQHKKLIGFGADLITNKIKGYDLLIESLQHIQTKDVEIVIFGGNHQSLPPFKQPVHSLGYLNDDITLRLLYSALDAMIVPSRYDNSPQTVTEALSCGTPVAAFNSSGLPNLIDHQKNGYLAIPFDTQDLAHGIDWILSHPNPQSLSQNARQKALTEFDSNLSAQKHLELYQKLIA